MNRISALWANPRAGLPDHTPETCLSALMAQAFGGPSTHPVTECLEPPPHLAELCYVSRLKRGTDTRKAIEDFRAGKREVLR